MGTVKANCTNCPANQFDIYSYDFSTGEERPLFESGGYIGPPSIHGQYVTWQEFREDRGSDINLLELGTGHKRVIAQGGSLHALPLVSSDFVVWTVVESCDAPMSPPGERQTGAFALNLKTN